jgi:hypothetical protein
MEASRSSNAITFQVSNNLRSDNFGFVCLAPRRPTHHPSRLIDRTSWGTCPLQASSRKVRMVFLPRTYSGYLVQRPAGRPAVPVRDPVKWVRPRSRRAAWPIERCQLATAHCTRAHMRPAAADRIGISDRGFLYRITSASPKAKPIDEVGRSDVLSIPPSTNICFARRGGGRSYFIYYHSRLRWKQRGFGLRSVDAIAAFFHRLHQSTSCTCWKMKDRRKGTNDFYKPSKLILATKRKVRKYYNVWPFILFKKFEVLHTLFVTYFVTGITLSLNYLLIYLQQVFF